MNLPTPPPSRLQALLFVLGLPLLLILVLAAAVLWRLDSRARKEARAVALEYRALRTAHYPRPALVEHPTPGTFAQALEPLLPALHDAALSREGQDLETVLEGCWDFVRKGPLEHPLTDSCHESLQRFEPLMRQVLRAARAEEAGLPEELLLATIPGQSGDWRLETMHGLISLAALEARLQASTGQADPGWELCLDALALSRDLSLGSGEEGALRSTHDHDVLFPPCAAALAGASASSLRGATVALRHLREGLRPLSAAMEEGRTLNVLQDAVPLLDAEEAKGLPTFGPPHHVETGGSLFHRRTYRGLEPLLTRDAFLAQREDQRRLASLVDLPLAPCLPALQRLGQEEIESRNPQRATVALAAVENAVRVDRQRLEVDVLLALALVRLHRAEHGRWPSTLPPLYPERPVVRPTSVRMHAGPGDTLVLEPEPTLVHALADFIAPEEQEGALMEFQVTAVP